MRIGYCVEGSADRAFLKGLKQRWCPEAELVEGPFRGTTHLAIRREFKKIAEQFALQGVDFTIVLRDANNENWREVKRNETEKFPPQRKFQLVFGVADRNIESWLCADADWIAGETKRRTEEFRLSDPKDILNAALEISSFDKKEGRISKLIETAPANVLKKWMENRSFKDFYEQLWAMSKKQGCEIENLKKSKDGGR